MDPVGQNCGLLVFHKLTISLAPPPDEIIVGTSDRLEDVWSRWQMPGQFLNVFRLDRTKDHDASAIPKHIH
jgi:hypothetical protein